MKKYKICSRCVMDTSDEDIVFNDVGVCDHCVTFDNKVRPFWNPENEGWEQIQKLASEIKKEGIGREFDCIVGMSGGIDSSYLVYLAKEKLGLRPLVFHVDAGWNSEKAVSNIEQIVDRLDLDLYTEVIDWEDMRELQLSFFKSGVSHIDTPQDHSFFATMYKFANKYGIKHILTGGNYSTEGIRNPLGWMYFQSDVTQIKDIQKKFGTRKLKRFPTTNIFWHKFYLPYIKGIRVHRPLDYMHYNKEEATRFLVDNYGYQRYAQKHFESRFTRFYESYWLPKKFGFDTRKVQYSSLIVTGQMTRDAAISKLKEPAHDKDTLDEDIEYIANKLRISVDELESYLQSPNKSFKDYKNQYFLYYFGAKILRFLGIERGGKR